ELGDDRLVDSGRRGPSVAINWGCALAAMLRLAHSVAHVVEAERVLARGWRSFARVAHKKTPARAHERGLPRACPPIPRHGYPASSLPPSTSGLGRHPFKVVARVRI